MPLFIFAYFLIEALAFYGVARLIGVGWAILAIFALMFVGGAFASLSLRGTLVNAAEGKASLGRVAGDSALLMTGWLLSIIPGFVSSVFGLLLVFGPTRGLLRRVITNRAMRSMEDFSVRVYDASPLSQFRTSYGHFGAQARTPGATSDGSYEQDREHGVIDADELEEMFRKDSAPGAGETHTPQDSSDGHIDGGADDDAGTDDKPDRRGDI